jgi:hypothetical protein
MSEGLEGTAWSDAHNDIIVADYFAMLAKQLNREVFSKADHYRPLVELLGRSKKSVEFKYMNISAVLRRLNLPWVQGYAPLANFQNSLIGAIERYLTVSPLAQIQSSIASREPVVNSPSSLWIGPPPTIGSDDIKTTSALDRLVRKFDPAERDARNRDLGKSGEERIFHYERDLLIAAGREDLARKVEWTSQERGDGAGYDIASFAPDGSTRLIEVKTTNGHAKTPFYMSENERLFSEEWPDAFRLMRLHDFSTKPSGFELRPPLENFLALQPISYRAALR